MNRKNLLSIVCLLTAMVMRLSNAPTAEKINTELSKPLPRVLLIGDSICGGYQRGVKKLLADKADVVKNKGNGEHTRTGLKKLDEWLGDGKWDVIHFNWGLWDVAYRNPKSKNFGHLDKVDGKLTTSLADYDKNLRTLVARLKKTGATLVWASTTPVPDGEPGRIKGDAVKYNAIAAKIMAANGIAIDDLHAEVIRQGRPRSNNVHDTGNLSRKVADSILAALASRRTAATPDKKPNIVFILADDMGFDSVSANNEKMVSLKTPHIDRLCELGMNFTDAHSGSAVCTPTRYGLLTGRYCWRTPLKKEVLWDYGRPLIEKERLTVADLLREKGYTTGMVGKWHLGLDWHDSNGKLANGELQLSDAIWRPGAGAERVKACENRIDFSQAITGGPVDHGFDYYFGVDLPNMPPYTWIENDRVTGYPSVPKPKEMFGTEGPMVPGWKLEEILPTLAKRAAEWISEQSQQQKPFFLYLSLTSPHTPIAPSKPFQGKSGVSRYADFIIETDWVVGRIMEALDKAGAADDTLVIFTTDNGTATAARFRGLEKQGINLRYHFSGHKGKIAEGGHRVPFVVRWPGTVKPASTCSQVVCLNDFMATVADILDVPLPENAAEDSASILPLLNGEKNSLPERPLVVNHDYRGNFAIRKGKWKLVPGKTARLFDLEADPKEKKDVAKQNPAIVKHMADTLKIYQENGRSRRSAQ